jgi:FkbM family methyltransferase
MTLPSVSQTDAAETYVFSEGWYENAELRNLPKLLAGVRMFVDIGASVGPYTKCANDTMRGGRIIAVEANRSTYERLAENCKQWEAQSSNKINTIHAAVADALGTVDFFVPSNNELPLTSSLIQTAEGSAEWRKETVPCVVLDEILAQESPDLIKLDIEGAEYRALLGSRKLLEAGKCNFLIEIHPWGDPELSKTPEDVFKLLYSYGYDFKVVSRHWYFQKRRKSPLMAVKHQAIRFVMRHGQLKEYLKKIVLAFRKMRTLPKA